MFEENEKDKFMIDWEDIEEKIGPLTSEEINAISLAPYTPRPTEEGYKRAIRIGKNYISTYNNMCERVPFKTRDIDKF